MIIQDQLIEIKISSFSNKRKYFLAKGYKPNSQDIIYAKVEDLPEGSHYKVKVICDYCGDLNIKPFSAAIRITKHCCKKCIYKKAKETNLEKYGVENPGQMEDVREKVVNTMVERYGVTNAYQIESVRKTTLKNLGVEFPFQSEKVREKQKETMLDIYGVENPTSNEDILSRVVETNIQRYGVKNPMQVTEFREKQIIASLKTMYENGTIQTSSQQIHIHKLIGGKLNYPVDLCSLDIALVDENLYIEYNGGGHYAWPKINGMSDEEHHRKEMNRYSYLKQRGWKLIRIVCKSDKLYEDEKLLKLIDESKYYLLNSNHSWIEINIDDNKMVCSEFEKSI